MISKKNLLFATFFFAISISSCKKNNIEENKQQVNSLTKVYKLPTTESEKALVKNLEKTTSVFKELYKNRKNISLVNVAVTSKQYHDEGVLIRDLIYPINSILKNNTKFNSGVNKINYTLTDFANAFWAEVNKGNDLEFKAFLTGLNSATARNTNNGDGQDPSVYFPYSENFVNPDNTTTYGTITSLVTATADADEGWGSLPQYVNGILQGYVQVLINDEYTAGNPTHVVGVVGLEDTYPMGVDSVPPPPPPPPGVTRVYMGYSTVKNQYDRLISFTGNGGASEMRYCHLTGYLQPANGQVTSFQDVISVSFSRKRIKDRYQLRMYSVWDDDWAVADNEQVLGIYEEDNTNTKTFSGSIGTTVLVTPGTTITGNIGFSVSVTSQDDIIRQLKISRNSYFTGSFQDQGWGRKNDDYTFLPLPNVQGWPWYDGHPNNGGADVVYTWPYKVL